MDLCEQSPTLCHFRSTFLCGTARALLTSCSFSGTHGSSIKSRVHVVCSVEVGIAISFCSRHGAVGSCNESALNASTTSLSRHVKAQKPAWMVRLTRVFTQFLRGPMGGNFSRNRGPNFFPRNKDPGRSVLLDGWLLSVQGTIES